ncbi:TPA: hypothetical protein RFV71_000398 [Klebsiella quasipneumoniae subsp. quasipneumoniae]|nr:hypothetical protein [Klebsiella quasipneumoniae subsp. quasipneumoniae]
MKRINERAWEVFGIYGRVCESCSGAIALSLLQALAMFGCLEKRRTLFAGDPETGFNHE